MSNRRDRDRSAVVNLRRRIAHSRAEAALYRWASDRDGDTGFQKAVHDAVGSMDNVAIEIGGVALSPTSTGRNAGKTRPRGTRRCIFPMVSARPPVSVRVS
ncbi:hypothetical protein GCM10027598_80360 [Amycolatopsis oliviviridis]